jgi:hypothetical protein
MIGVRLRGVAQLLIRGVMLTLPVFCDCQSPGSITNGILCRNDVAGSGIFRHVPTSSSILGFRRNSCRQIFLSIFRVGLEIESWIFRWPNEETHKLFYSLWAVSVVVVGTDLRLKLSKVLPYVEPARQLQTMTVSITGKGACCVRLDHWQCWHP